MFRQEIIVIEGPTASGKTALAIEVANALDTVIISSDSRQFYSEMSIGTAKPDASELAAAPHYFINSHSIHHPLSAGKFAEEAGELLRTPELERRKFVVVAGGSGMFTDALVEGLDNIPTDPALQAELQRKVDACGLEELLYELKEKDPAHFAVIDSNNVRRVIRAVEAIRLTGKPYSELRSQSKTTNIVHRFQLIPDRAQLYERIDQRVDDMMDKGLLREVKELLKYAHLRPLQTVGYQEFFPYFRREITLDAAVNLVKQHTRNYAKRQLTWFRRKPAEVLTSEETAARAQELLRALELD